MPSSSTTARWRLARVQHELTPPPHSLGTLRIGPDIALDVPASAAPERLPRVRPLLLDVAAGVGVGEDLRWMVQKYVLGQDMFILAPHGPYARRLVMTFCAMVNAEYEYVALHRDVGESELKQAREIHAGGDLAYVDSPAVRAVKLGRVLVLDGVEKAERGIMPLLNNLLENREMNLDDGTHIVHAHRHALLPSSPISSSDSNSPTGLAHFVPAHPRFRVIALAAPVPPNPGHALDPPFRSRFQARAVDPVRAMRALAVLALKPSASASFSVLRLETASSSELEMTTPSELETRLRALILTTQHAHTGPLDDLDPASAIPPFPQPALARLARLCAVFPPPSSLSSPETSPSHSSSETSPSHSSSETSSPPLSSSETSPPPLSPTHLARLILALHPRLRAASRRAWTRLSERAIALGLGPFADFEVSSPTSSSSASPSKPESPDPSNTNPPESELDPHDVGLLGYVATSIERASPHAARVTFVDAHRQRTVTRVVPAGSGPFAEFPPVLAFDAQSDDSSPARTSKPSPRFIGLLTCLLQAHALGADISYVPPAAPAHASCSTSTLVRAFASALGYGTENVHVWKEMGGRELVARRIVRGDGATDWEPSAIVAGALAGRLVHIAGLDVLGLTAGSLARLVHDREIELWHGRRIVAAMDPSEDAHGLASAHPSFRLIATASGAQPLRDWLTDEHASMFFAVPALAMPRAEERAVLCAAGCPADVVDRLLDFAQTYRASLTADAAVRNRRLGTRALVRIARRLAFDGHDGPEGAYELLGRALLKEFLPTIERASLESMLTDAGITPIPPAFHPAPELTPTGVRFPAPLGARAGRATELAYFADSRDPTGAGTLVPHMDDFFDNSIQSAQMRALGVDLEILGEHLVLLGNQGVGKNKLVDRLCQLLRRPREYVQLHRDSTVHQLLFTTALARGVLRHEDSPLLRAVRMGRVLVVDEADKAPEHVVAVLKSLAGQGELSLPDGRRVMRTEEREEDVVIAPGFRLILLANRPGYPFLGNHFLQVLGDNFSCHSVSNPDLDSELRLLSQLAPELGEDTLRRLVGAFQDLRRAHDDGSIAYPYSLRELIAIVRHMRAYPDDALNDALRNVFDFDVHRPGVMDKLADILKQHGLRVQRAETDAVSADKKKVLDVAFEPKKTDLDKPKFGKEDPDNAPHSGGNTWAGGTGGRDTAGLGGRGGYMRLYTGHDIKQISDKLKQDVPDAIREQAREMARQELARRLQELNMSAGEAKVYGDLLNAVQAHIAQLHDLLENLAAKEEERVWVKRQTDGELDDSRLTEGLTGEATVYKRRGMAKPELGRPQMKPKRIRFLFDVSGSMYRFQYDGRLQRSLETAVMLMESFNRLTRKDKYAWDIYGHSGDSPEIPIVSIGESVAEVSDRWKAVKKMDTITQYTFAGDYTVDALQKASDDVAKFDGDDYFVIAITDANFARYGITAEDLQRAMNRHPKVKVALICIGEGAEAAWVPKQFPGRAFRVEHTADIPKVLRGILSTMVEKAG